MADGVNAVHRHVALRVMGVYAGVAAEEKCDDFGPAHHYRTHQNGAPILPGSIHVRALFNQNRCQ